MNNILKHAQKIGPTAAFILAVISAGTVNEFNDQFAKRLGMTPESLKKHRDVLVARGLIKYTPGGNRKPARFESCIQGEWK